MIQYFHISFTCKFSLKMDWGWKKGKRKEGHWSPACIIFELYPWLWNFHNTYPNLVKILFSNQVAQHSVAKSSAVWIFLLNTSLNTLNSLNTSFLFFRWKLNHKVHRLQWVSPFFSKISHGIGDVLEQKPFLPLSQCSLTKLFHLIKFEEK